MPPQSPSPNSSKSIQKFNFFYGHRHRNPTQHRPTVYGGLFSSRQSRPPLDPHRKPISRHPRPFNLQKWDPFFLSSQPLNSSTPSPSPSPSKPSSENVLSRSLRLSPIARFILDAFRKNQGKWGPPVISELNKLRRVTPKLVSEVLKAIHLGDSNPIVASKFFHWAGKQKGFHHDFASYNALAYCLNRCHHFRAADQVPELMNAQGKQPSEKQFEILIRMHSDANRGLRVYYVYEKMKKFGIKPRVFLYNRIMDALVKTNHLDLAISVYGDFKDDGLVEESTTFMILIKGLCKAGRIEEMLEILGRMRKNLCKPDVFAYTAMIRVLVSEGNPNGGLRVWEEMKADGVKPDVMAYATMITGLCREGKAEKGYELFKEMKKMGILIDRVIYRLLIEAIVGYKKLDLACNLFKDLVDSGYRADLGIYRSLIKGMCAAKHVDKAYKLFQVTVQEELKPDFTTVNPILMAYAEEHRMEDFCKLLLQMKKLGLSVIDDLAMFFSGLVEKDGTIAALQVFEDLKTRGYLSIPIYVIVMEALLKNGEAKKALALFQEIKGSKLELNASLYSISLLCFVEIWDIEKACDCHNKIIEMSSIPSVDAYHALAKGLSKVGEIDAAMMLVRDCLGNYATGPMAFKYALTIIHICKSGNADRVIEVLNEMIDEGSRPDDVIFSAVISGMCKYGMIEEGRKVFSYLRERKLLSEADMIVCDEFLIEHMKKKTADLVRCGLKFFNLESKLKAKGCTLLS